VHIAKLLKLDEQEVIAQDLPTVREIREFSKKIYEDAFNFVPVALIAQIKSVEQDRFRFLLLAACVCNIKSLAPAIFVCIRKLQK